jgi:transcriptional regulator with XRE-family HTH domain
MTLPQNIKYLRKSRGLTYAELEDKIGCPRGSVKAYESGETVPELQEMAAMAQLFKVALEDLMFRDIAKRGPSDRPRQNGDDISGKDVQELLSQAKKRIEFLKEKIRKG